MLSLGTVRRICAAIDAVAITCIAAGISKSVKKRDISNYAHSANHHPENFPTIESCRAALLKKGKILAPKPKTNNDLGPQDNSNEPAIIRMKKERHPEKLFSLFQSNAQNRFVVENCFIFEDMVYCLTGAQPLDLIEQILECQKGLPQGRREGFVMRIIALYGMAPKPKTNNDLGPQDNSNEPAIIRMKKERHPEKLFSLFQSNAQNRIVVENRFIFEDMASRLAGAQRLDLIEQILECQKGLPQGRREGFVMRIIALYGMANLPDLGVKTFQEMHLFGCKRTVKSFNATLKVLSQASRFHELCQLFDNAPQIYGIQLDEISYNTVIKVMCEMGSLDSAYGVMLEMGKLGVKPDVVTYTTLISAFYKKSLRKIGDGLWNLMRLRGCNPNLATYNVRIQYLINRHRTFEANNLVRSMHKSGIKPDEVTYNLIIKGFFIMGEVKMANNVFYSMGRRGCEPNGKIYQTMVHYLCEERDFGLAFRLCKKSMERNWYPSVDTIWKLLKGLIAVSKDINAREIMRLVVRRIPRHSSEEIMSLQEIMSREH